MDRQIAVELQQLKEKILAMGGYVEVAIQEATRALIERAPQRLAKVYEVEAKINQAHMEVDEMCMRLLARQAPVAADLRLVLAVVKVNADLERMGDQAVNISHNTKDYLAQPALMPVPPIEEMSAAVTVMVKGALDAFMHQDAVLADSVLKQDDVVDDFKNEIFRSLIARMKSAPHSIDACLDLILIARNLERLGDHATNIAEDAIFAYTGQDIRHKPREAGQV